MQLSWNTLLSFLLNLHQVFFTLLRFWMAESSILLLRAVWSEHCWLSIWIQEKFVEQCIQVCWFLHHERKREIIPWDRNNWIYSCCCLVGFIVTQSIFCHRASFLLLHRFPTKSECCSVTERVLQAAGRRQKENHLSDCSCTHFEHVLCPLQLLMFLRCIRS